MRFPAFAGICLLLAFTPSACLAEWPMMPAVDLRIDCPRCPSESANWTDWEDYRTQLEQFLAGKVEAFWTKVNTNYRLSLERERQHLDTDLSSRRISKSEYEAGLTQYRARIATINADLRGVYEVGLRMYWDGMNLYDSATNRLGQDASTER
jgi:hypothetical protein